MDIRAKAILSVMCIIATLASTFAFLSIQQQHAHLHTLIETKQESAKFLAASLQEQVFSSYKARIVSLATTKKEVVEAFAKRDREALHQATLPFYNTIKNENPHFAIMHFHLPDNSSFLRMHLPRLHGDDLAEIRPMVREVNASHKQMTGYEVGKMGLFFRIVQPVFHEGLYVGALEFGIRHEQLADLLRQRISPEIAVAVQSAEWKKASLFQEKTISLGAYTLLPMQSALFGSIAHQPLRDKETRLNVDGREYILFSDIDLKDFQQQPLAKIIIALDISQETSSARKLIIKVALLSLLLLLIAGLVLYVSFGQLLRRIFSLNASLTASNQELATAKASVENILATMSDGLLVTAADGTINRANKACCRLIGRDESALIGKSIFPFLDNSADLQESFANCGPNDCEIAKTERQLVAGDGHRVPVLFSATSLADQEGRLDAIVCIVTDITERKKAETSLRQVNDLLEQRVEERTRELGAANDALTREMAERQRAEAELRQAQKMRAIGTLAGGIAHDFNNILSAIIGYTQLARELMKTDQTCASYLDEVFTAGLRARDLVQQILTFSRQGEQERKPVEIQPIVKEALKLLRASLPANIEIVQDISPRCGAILADPTQIHQVVMNLCTNAWHAMQQTGGTLTVTLAESPSGSMGPGTPACDSLRLMVGDTGCGMDGATIERIFEPYFTTKDSGKGTGLGLAVTHGIVSSHGGQITISSTPGSGSTFSVVLPLHHGAAPLLQERGEDTLLHGGTERILVVDDEKEISQLLQLFLEGHGYRITAMTDSIAAWQWFAANPAGVDLVITDMAMPKLTGLDLSRKMLAERPDLPIILCTGYSEVINAENARQHGIRAFFLKPFQERELAALVRSVLDGGTPAD